MQNLILNNMQPKVQSDDERNRSIPVVRPKGRSAGSRAAFGCPPTHSTRLTAQGEGYEALQQSKSCHEAHTSHCARCGTPMKVRILIPGCKVDYVAYRCEKCGTDVLRSVPRAG